MTVILNLTEVQHRMPVIISLIQFSTCLLCCRRGLRLLVLFALLQKRTLATCVVCFAAEEDAGYLCCLLCCRRGLRLLVLSALLQKRTLATCVVCFAAEEDSGYLCCLLCCRRGLRLLVFHLQNIFLS